MAIRVSSAPIKNPTHNIRFDGRNETYGLRTIVHGRRLGIMKLLVIAIPLIVYFAIIWIMTDFT